MRAGFSSNMTIGQIRELFTRSKEVDSEDDDRSSSRKSSGDNLLDNFRVSHEVQFVWDPTRDRDVFRLKTNNIRLYGDLDLTVNWRFSVGIFGFEFVRL